MGVGRSDTLDQDDAEVRLVITIRVFKEKDVRLRRDDHPSAPEREAQRVVNPGELDRLVGDPVAVFIRQDQEAVGHFLEWLPFRISVPAGRPEASLGIDLHLHRVRYSGEHFFIREQVDLESLRHVHLGDRLLAA